MVEVPLSLRQARVPFPQYSRDMPSDTLLCISISQLPRAASIMAAYRYLRGRDGPGEGDAKLLGGARVDLAALPLIVLASAVLR
jgi:hypothetical protein